LLDQSVRAVPRVLEKAVAVAVAIAQHPRQRRHQVGPEMIDEGAVGGPAVVGRRECDEQRCRVDASVVPAERHFPERRHFPLPHFVEDLSRLGVLRV